MSCILKEPIREKCAWKGVDLRNKTDWIYHFPPAVLEVLDNALNHLAQKASLSGILCKWILNTVGNTLTKHNTKLI